MFGVRSQIDPGDVPWDGIVDMRFTFRVMVIIARQLCDPRRADFLVTRGQADQRGAACLSERQLCLDGHWEMARLGVRTRLQYQRAAQRRSSDCARKSSIWVIRRTVPCPLAFVVGLLDKNRLPVRRQSCRADNQNGRGQQARQCSGRMSHKLVFC